MASAKARRACDEPSKATRSRWNMRGESPVVGVAPRARVSRGPRGGDVAGGVERHVCVGVGAARAHLGSYPNGLHELVFGGTPSQRRLGVGSDAVRALGDMSSGDSDELLGLGVQGTVGEHLSAELLKGVVGTGSKLLAPLRDLGGGGGIDGLRHDVVTSGSPIARSAGEGCPIIVRAPRSRILTWHRRAHSLLLCGQG